MTRKRSRTQDIGDISTDETVSDFKIDISPEFLSECEEKFKSDPSNIISRNAVVCIGSMLATTDSNRLNDINHIFMNSIKRKHIKEKIQLKIPTHKWFVGVQFHPELKSTVLNPHPLFVAFIKACLEKESK